MPRVRAGSKAIIALKPPVMPLCQMADQWSQVNAGQILWISRQSYRPR